MDRRKRLLVVGGAVGVTTGATLLIWFGMVGVDRPRPLVPRSLSAGWIGKSLDFHKKIYGDETEINTYRPDLYPTSYVFKKDGITVTLTPLPTAVAKIDVYFESVPPEPVQLLLEHYSGVTDWKSLSLTDPEFERQFPLFSTTDSRNAFFTSKGVTALVQHDVGFGKLVLWIQANDYQRLLEQYRKTAK